MSPEPPKKPLTNGPRVRTQFAVCRYGDGTYWVELRIIDPDAIQIAGTPPVIPFGPYPTQDEAVEQALKLHADALENGGIPTKGSN